MRLMLFPLVAGLLSLAPIHAHAETSPCSDLLPTDTGSPKTQRFVTAADFVRLRDIGPVDNGDPTARLLAVSPDGEKIAFQIRRANPATNNYCFGMFVMDIGPNGHPHAVDIGGDYLLYTGSAAGFAQHTPPGIALTITPKWSPDGKQIAFLRRDQGVTQVWRAQADGSGSVPVNHVNFDIEDFVWSADGRDIIITGRPTLAEAGAAIEAEGKTGFLYDDRYFPPASNRPFIREPIPHDAFAIDVVNGQMRPATDMEALHLKSTSATLSSPAVENDLGDRVWSAPKDAENVTSPTALHVKWASGREERCSVEACDNVFDLLWSPDARSVIYLRHEGWALSQTGLYAWAPGHDPRRIWLSDDVLIGCAMARDGLVCGHETSDQPRRPVLVNLSNGHLTDLFNPNPEFNDIKLGSVERLHWKNAAGIETFGDLVLPPNHQSGQKHPLIVVQYQSRGFLRGGTGDEYPIQFYAAHGYAVLSFHGPVSVAYRSGAKTWQDITRLNRVDWADRRSILSALETGVQLAVSKGWVDPDRIGITGLSDGASTAQFALVNSHIFKAAAISTCCEEASIVDTLDGPVVSQWLHDMGYPSILDDGAAFWSAMSLRRNAARIDTPLLIQVPDIEYLGALEGYTALKAARQPVEMYVFPNEYHVKWQPEHRQVVFQRSLDWFDYWLKGQEDPDPGKAAKYQRWDALRRQKEGVSDASPGQ